MRFLYIIYQVCIALPIFLVTTILTAIITVVGCRFGNGHFGDITLENYGRK